MKSVFLVTTGLSESRGDVAAERLLLAGSWCLRETDDDNAVRVLPSLWGNSADRAAAYRRAQGVREQILPILAGALNRIHGTDHGLRYWRIMLMPWLSPYVEIMLDRTAIIDAALADSPALTTVGLHEDCWAVPATCLEFPRLVLQDAYNLQLFTQVLRIRGRSYGEVAVEVSPLPFGAEDRSSALRRRLRRAARRLAVRIPIWLPWAGRVVMRQSYFARAVELGLALVTLGRIWPSLAPVPDLPTAPPDSAKRAALAEALADHEGESQRTIRETIALNIPQCFLETYEGVVEAARTWYPKRPRAILSANSWYYDEPFKHAAAAAAEKGTLLLACQHGWSYGCLEIMPSEEHELAFADVYFTWGWDGPAKCIPMSATKLAGLRGSGSPKAAAERILFVGSAEPRYLLSFALPPGQIALALAWQERFAQSLGAQLRARLFVRHYPEDYGWDIRGKWRRFAPEVREDGHATFTESMAASDMVVCDHMGTTFLEAVAADKPCMLILAPQSYLIRASAQPYFSRLKEAGVLFECPEAAAAAIADIAPRLRDWWTEPARQAAICELRGHFARVSPSAYREWLAELTIIAGLPDRPATAGSDLAHEVEGIK